MNAAVKPTNSRFQDLEGQTFGRLVVVGFAGRRGRRLVWLCCCECGREKEVVGGDLKKGDVKSCGCLQTECRKAAHKHGHALGGKQSPEYQAWSGIVQRCENESHAHYVNYGGRGILVCSRWRNSFEAFLSDMGLRPSAKHSIDRKDNDGNYEPENCRWATRKQQGRNTRASRLLTVYNETKTLAEWCELRGIAVTTVWMRIFKYGWSDTRAVTTPARRKV